MPVHGGSLLSLRAATYSKICRKPTQHCRVLSVFKPSDPKLNFEVS